MSDFDFNELSDSITSDSDSSSDWEPEPVQTRKKNFCVSKSKAVAVKPCSNQLNDDDDDLAVYDDTDTELPNQAEIPEERKAAKPLKK